MNMTAEERITRSRVRLLLTKPFFGQLATRMKLIERPDMPTAATDGRNFFNREFVDRLNDDELDFLVGHEVLHMVFDHVDARGDRDPMIYNMACDFNINMTLVEQKVGTVIGEDKLNGGKPHVLIGNTVVGIHMRFTIISMTMLKRLKWVTWMFTLNHHQRVNRVKDHLVVKMVKVTKTVKVLDLQMDYQKKNAKFCAMKSSKR